MLFCEGSPLLSSLRLKKTKYKTGVTNTFHENLQFLKPFFIISVSVFKIIAAQRDIHILKLSINL